MELIDYFLGEPEYDENGNVVKRNFQIQNLLFVIFTGYLLYSLWCKTKKQVGGMNGTDAADDFFDWEDIYGADKKAAQPRIIFKTLVFTALITAILLYFWHPWEKQ